VKEPPATAGSRPSADVAKNVSASAVLAPKPQADPLQSVSQYPTPARQRLAVHEMEAPRPQSVGAAAAEGPKPLPARRPADRATAGQQKPKRKAARQREILEDIAEEQHRYGVSRDQPHEAESGTAMDEPHLIPEFDPGYDPNWAAEGPHRFPAASKGEWVTGGAGDGRWQPHDPGAYGLDPGQSVPFKEGVPDFTEYTVPTPSGQPGTVEVQGLTGDGRSDYAATVQRLAAQEGMTPREVQQWLSSNNLRLHHFSGNEMQIVPERLHGALGHQGSRTEMAEGL
jgi:hypothetical protein